MGKKSIDDIDWNLEDKELIKVLEPLWLESFKEGFYTVERVFDFGLSWEVLNPRFLDWARENGAEKVKNINQTTQNDIQTAVAEAIELGEGLKGTERRIREKFSQASKNRTRTIARTETHNSVGSGVYSTYKTAGVEQKEWLTSIDGRERPSHQAINGQVRGIDQPFDNGLMFPGDPAGSAKEVINCRCTLLPVFAEVPAAEETATYDVADYENLSITGEWGLDSRVADISRDSEWLISDAEAFQHVNSYTKNGYKRINSVFRGHLKYDEIRDNILREETKQAVKFFKKGFQEAIQPLSQNILLYRHDHMDAARYLFDSAKKGLGDKVKDLYKKLLRGEATIEEIKNLSLGAIIKDKAPLSTSYSDREFLDDGGIELEILAPKGAKIGNFIEQASSFQPEAEFLIQPAQNFEVVDVKEVKRYGKIQLSFTVIPK